MAGPLSGYRVIEIAGIGPGPFAAMLLSDLGAEVIRVERAQSVRGPAPETPHFDILLRGRRNIAIDLKNPAGVETLLTLVEGADAIIEGFRPGVMERLGIGPDACLARNPKVVFGRMTGWGQTGMYGPAAGHDINYISLAGALKHFGRAGEMPTPPLNMVGDFGGGGMFLALGVVAALLEAQKSGKGQVVDTAMVDGTAVLMSMFWAMKNVGMFNEDEPGTNLLDTGAHFYDVYKCKDGEYVSLGSIEATDVCFAPVLTMSQAAQHPHNVERKTFVEHGGVMQPSPAPRFSRTQSELTLTPAHAGQHTREVLEICGFATTDIDALVASGAVKEA